MVRLISILRYERLYWASTVLGLVASALMWSERAAVLATNPILASAPWILSITQAIGIAIALLLRYFTARAPSVVAKWVVMVFAALGVLAIVLSLGAIAVGRAANVTTLGLSIVINALYVAAAVLLFKPDARLWFGEAVDRDTDADDIDEEYSHDR